MSVNAFKIVAGVYAIYNVGSGRYLDLDGNNASDGAESVTVYSGSWPYRLNKRWFVQVQRDGTDAHGPTVSIQSCTTDVYVTGDSGDKVRASTQLKDGSKSFWDIWPMGEDAVAYAVFEL